MKTNSNKSIWMAEARASRTAKRKGDSRAAHGSPQGCIATPKAKAMARHIFRAFDHGKDKCQRLAAHGGKWPDAESKLGGLCEYARDEMIERAMSEANGPDQGRRASDSKQP